VALKNFKGIYKNYLSKFQKKFCVFGRVNLPAKLFQNGSAGASPSRRLKSVTQTCFGFFYLVFIALTCCLFTQSDSFAQVASSTTVSLYFLDNESLRLSVEKRAINKSPNTVEQAKLTIAELIKGPTMGLIPTIPEGTKLREVFLDEKGCAYVDFSREISQNHPSSTTSELITISSIVNTLNANFPEEVQKVQILIDGKGAMTIAGHIDISMPIFPFELE
jgi:hypothetical protein